MGFSVTIGHAIFAIALLAAGSQAVVQGTNAWQKVQNADAVAHDLRMEREQTKITITSQSWSNGQGGRLTINVKNDGTTVLDASLVSVILDGKIRDTSITSRTINGVSVPTGTKLWPPGTTLVILVNPVSNPARTWVVTHNGVADLYP